jgi:hypothetical protein
VKAKEIEARLGDSRTLRSVQDIKAEIAGGMTSKLQTFIKDVERDAARRSAVIDFRKADLLARQREERQRLADAHERRWQAETKARAERLPRGFSGIWHRLTGRYAKVKAQNERETLEAWRRDRAEKDTLISRHLQERQVLRQDMKAQRALAQQEVLQLREDVARYQTLDCEGQDHRPARAREDHATKAEKRTREEGTRRRRGFEP